MEGCGLASTAGHAGWPPTWDAQYEHGVDGRSQRAGGKVA